MSYQDISNYYEQLFPFSDKKLEFLKKRLDNSEHCLDFGCGIGNYTNALVNSGVNCIGVDPDRAMIERAKNFHKNCNFYQLFMEDFDQKISKADAAFCIGNTLAYLSPKNLNQFLEKLSKAIPKGGKWILQVLNWDYVLTQKMYSFPDTEVESKNLIFKRWYDKITVNSLEFHREVQLNSKTISKSTDQLFPLTKIELETVHKKYEFELVECYADFNETPFITDNDSGLVMIFEKKY